MHIHGAANGRKVAQHKNKKWVSGQAETRNGRGADAERWDRGGHRRGGDRSGRGGSQAPLENGTHLTVPDNNEDDLITTDDDDASAVEVVDPGLDEPFEEPDEDPEAVYQQLVKAREVERQKAIREGKMDDPNVRKRLEDAITMVGTCMDMCPRFERYRRMREHNLDKWEVIPGTKRVDHRRAVKIYERAAGDKVIPSDLRPPPVLKKTLDYLFHELLATEGFERTHDFIRDRSRAVRNDFTVQHEIGPIAIECHERCARFHIMALHMARKLPVYDQAMEIMQLQNSMYSLCRGYQSPAELEMRVYRRLTLIRAFDRDVIPDWVNQQPIFQLATKFRDRVHALSKPITKASKLIVDGQAMEIFGQLITTLREQDSSAVMMFLVACIMQGLFGEDTVDSIDGLRGDMSVPDIIDGVYSTSPQQYADEEETTEEAVETVSPSGMTEVLSETEADTMAPPVGTQVVEPSATEWLANNFNNPPPYTQPSASAFGGLGSTTSAFGFDSASTSAFGNLSTAKASPFGGATFGPTSSSSTSAFNPNVPHAFGNGSSAFSAPPTTSTPPSKHPVTSQPTWPADAPMSNGFTGMLPPPSTSIPFSLLNPTAPSFASTQPSTASHSSPFGLTSAPTAPPAVHNTRSPVIPTLESPPDTIPEKEPTPPTAPPETPSRIVERRQTLWDLPGSSSPFNRLKEDRMTYTPQPGTTVEPRTPISPTAGPPSLGRQPPMELPPTPTARWFDPPASTSLPESLSKKRSLLHFPSITIPSPTPADVLSPIHINTPSPEKLPSKTNGKSSLFQSFVADEPVASTSTTTIAPQPSPAPTTPTTPIQTPTSATSSKKPILGIKTNGISQPLLPSAPSAKGKEKETQADVVPVSLDAEREARALAFARTSGVVRDCWARWRKARAWAGACRRSEAYSVKLSASTSGPVRERRPLSAMQKRRRESAPIEARRHKRRKSNQFVQPLTDAELAKRLQKNYAENEKRWAHGSFRETIVDTLKSRLSAGVELAEWTVWLAINAENDNTAIWLQTKFDVPDSGSWMSEHVFTIPAFTKMDSAGSPGLIVFERTPLEDVDDVIERKYRVLDDCARLRDILATLPPKDDRRYVPCLMVIGWSDKVDGEQTKDFVDMTHELVRDGVLRYISYFDVSATAKEVDYKFAEAMQKTPLDTEDQLSVSFGWEDVQSIFVAPVELAIADMLDCCWRDDELNWARYDLASSGIEDVLNIALRAILGLFNDTPSHVSVEIPEDLPQPAALGRAYATKDYIEALSKLLTSSARELVGARLPLSLPSDIIDFAASKLEKVINAHAEKLRQLVADQSAAAVAAATQKSWEPLPKRRSSNEALRYLGAFEPSSKRARLTPDEDATDANTSQSISPPPSTTAMTELSEKPIVTVAMLRELTRSVMKTYK
ncbi:uncharacterized protein BXZ73DRAFT_89187 [Epithele typhae]|uniref:uncharacterized protein n=1 Tax=Epithele typhae TaxID=378194 RepID=UPI002008DC17|nr:uncharacterized protein BXZ73DRAFT_89187 [Epithele typhae]KAH9938812.1 hypothetical protein BXZ73DRAFT_89187 [Epithele typhae]